MKLRTKLPLAFALALAFLFAGAMFGLMRLSNVVDVYQQDVMQTSKAHQQATAVAVAFAGAIQEWKNVLLRGKDPKDLDKYWRAHLKAMDDVRSSLATLDATLRTNDEKALSAELAQAIHTLQSRL